MNQLEMREPGDGASVPDRFALAAGLSWLRSGAAPRAVATREVVVRRGEGDPGRVVFRSGEVGGFGG